MAVPEPFFERIEEINGKKFKIIDYKLAVPKHFDSREKLNYRGLTIDLQSGRRYYPIHKFFNVGEVETVEDLDGIPFIIYEKVDGSMIMFVDVDGKLIAKTRKTFYSNQAMEATRLVEERPFYKEFIRKLLDDGLQPIFEYISPTNQIVVDYNFQHLVLLAVRDDEGSYHNIDEFDFPYKARNIGKIWGVREVVELCKHLENIEGFVLVNERNPFHRLKVKTKWYLSLHKIFTENEFREDHLIYLSIENKIDDVLLNARGIKLEYSIYLTENLVSFLHKKVLEILNSYDDGISRKDYAIKYKSDYWFPVRMRCFNSRDFDCVYSAMIEYIRKECRTLSKARDFIRRIGLKTFSEYVDEGAK